MGGQGGGWCVCPDVRAARALEFTFEVNMSRIVAFDPQTKVRNKTCWVSANYLVTSIEH